MRIIPTLLIQDNLYNYHSILDRYYENCIDTIRVNFSRHSIDTYAEHLKFISDYTCTMPYSFKYMLDLPVPGEKYRLDLEQGTNLQIYANDLVLFSNSTNTDPNNKIIGIRCSNLENRLHPGDRIYIGDGELELIVLESTNNGKYVVCQAKNNSIIRGQRSFMAPNITYASRALSTEMINFIKYFSPESIVLSFAEEAPQITQLKKEITRVSPYTNTIPKIETQKAINSIADFMQFDSFMLGRGDLALYSDLDQFGLNEQRFFNFIHQYHKTSIIATDILTSLYNQHIPSRGDLTDIYYLLMNAPDYIVASAGISTTDLFNRFSYICNSMNNSLGFSR